MISFLLLIKFFATNFHEILIHCRPLKSETDFLKITIEVLS